MTKENLTDLGFIEQPEKFVHPFGFIVFKHEMEKFSLSDVFNQALKFSFNKGKKQNYGNKTNGKKHTSTLTQ